MKVRYYADLARSYLEMQPVFARAGARTLANWAMRHPRPALWTFPYEGVVQLMQAGTPGGDIEDAEQIRKPLNRVALLSPTTSRTELVTVAGMAAEWQLPADLEPRRVVLYLHGGGYVSGSPRTHRAITARLAQLAPARVLVIDYRLAPESPYPAALEDAWAAYWWLLTNGTPAHQIVLAGDSAGGGLTVALLLALRDAHVPLPAAAVCLSPWLDLALTGQSVNNDRGADYLNRSVLATSADMYLAGIDPQTPLASPLYADLHGLPPMLLQAGTAELLLDDSIRFAARAHAAEIDLQLETWPEMIHVWHFTFLIQPKARAAMRRVAHFIRWAVPEDRLLPLAAHA
jgi:acetyl esterase/lipase